jgi:hypothetical protein
LAVPVVVWRRIPMTTRFRAGLPTYMREILRLVVGDEQGVWAVGYDCHRKA